jgi:anti-sigma B factor antagonist
VELKIDHVHLSDDAALVTIAGEIDVATAPLVRATIIPLVDSGRIRLVLDMTGTRWMDSTGIGVLVSGLKRCVAKDGLLVVVLGKSDVLHIFRTTGLSRVVKIFDDLSAATAMALDPSRRWNDPPQAHEYLAGAGWFELQIFTPDPATTEALEGAALSLLDTFDIVPRFKFRGSADQRLRESSMGIRESVGPISLSKQLEAIQLLIEKHAKSSTDVTANGPHDRPAANLVAVLNATTSSIIHIKTILVVKSKENILIQSFDATELGLLLLNNSMYRPTQLFDAIRSHNSRHSKTKKA